MQPILNRTTLSQEKVAYQQIRSSCHGDVLDKKHPLLSSPVKAQEVYGLWVYVVEKFVTSLYHKGGLPNEYAGDHHREKRIAKAQRTLSIMCICNDALVDLLNRYGNEREITQIFGQKYPLMVAEPYRGKEQVRVADHAA